MINLVGTVHDYGEQLLMCGSGYYPNFQTSIQAQISQLEFTTLISQPRKSMLISSIGELTSNKNITDL